MPTDLDAHLSSYSDHDAGSIASYVDRGAALVTPAAVQALHHLREPLRTKIDRLVNSERLRRRLELLASYFEESADAALVDPQVRAETAFALLYFLKGFDRIPDSVPEIGLLDDALIVDLVLQRHTASLRAHWQRQGRVWPDQI